MNEVENDLDGMPRPLDGDADGSAISDMGCYECLNAAAESSVISVRGTLSQETADRLMEIASKLDHLAADNTAETYPDFARLHQDFHLLIAESAGNRLLVELLKRVINPSLMLLNAKRSWKVPSELHQNHTVLMETIIDGDTGGAVRAMQGHIQIGLESELATL